MDNKIGERIKELRMNNAMSQADFGKALGVSQPRIWQFESGIKIPKYDTLCKIAETFDVSPFWLLAGEKNEPISRGETPSQRLKIAIDKSGYSLKKLSQNTGVHINLINEAIAGSYETFVIEKLAQSLGTTYDWIMSGYNQNEEQIVGRYKKYNSDISIENIKEMSVRLKSELDFQRLNYEDVATIVNISEDIILDYFDGSKLIPYDTLWQIAHNIHCDIDYLMLGNKKKLYEQRVQDVYKIIDYLNEELAYEELQKIGNYIVETLVRTNTK